LGDLVFLKAPVTSLNLYSIFYARSRLQDISAQISYAG
jgi:hypothetical protein